MADDEYTEQQTAPLNPPPSQAPQADAPRPQKGNRAKKTLAERGWVPDITGVGATKYFTDLFVACFAEFLALMIFVYIGVGTILATSGVMTHARLVAIALAHGLTIAIVVYLFNHISGGHANPAVTVALFLERQLDVLQAACYVLAQVGGGILGAVLLYYTTPKDIHGAFGTHALGEKMTPSMGFGMEAMLTFLLVMCVLLCAVDGTNGATKTTGMAPLVIGVSVVVEHLVGVPLTGACMNPARAFGPALVGDKWADHWIYWAGPITGAVLAVIVYKILSIKNKP